MTAGIDSSGGEHRLRRGVVGQSGVLAQSVAAVAPSGGVAVMGAVVVPLAGEGTWLAILAVTVIVSATAWVILRLCRRFSTTGGLYGITSRAGGPLGGVLTAAALIGIGLAALPAMIVVFTNYAIDFLHLLGVPVSTALLAAVCAAGSAAAAWSACRGIRLSTRVMLVLEIASILAITALFAVVLARDPHPPIDPAQLHLRGTSLPGLALAMVLSVFAFEGFESATVLGQEARAPRRTIPRAVVLSVLLSGLLFTFCAYSILLAYKGHIATLATATNPLSDLAHSHGVGWLALPVTGGIVLSAFAVIIATTNLVCRVVLTLGRERLLPAALASVNPRTRTPVRAIVVLDGFAVALALWIVIAHSAPVSFVAPLFALAGFFSATQYLIVTVSGARYFLRQGGMQVFDVVAVLVSGAGMAYVLYASLFDLPSHAFVIAGWLFGLTMAAGVVAYVYLARQSALSRVGSSVVHDTALGEHPPN